MSKKLKMDKDYEGNITNPLMPLTHSLRGVLKGFKISERDYKKYFEDKYLKSKTVA